MNRKRFAYNINVITFALTGAAFYLYKCLTSLGIPSVNPITSLGVQGVYIAIFGGSVSYCFFKYGEMRFYRALGLSFLIFVVWFFSLFFIGGQLEGADRNIFALGWIGAITVLYFMLIGSINAWFGRWIAFINLIILSEALVGGGSSGPIFWVSVLGAVGVEHPIAQWLIVLMSALLGFSDKGFNFFVESAS